MKNWAGNYDYATEKVHYPETVEQVQAAVAGCDKARVLGTRHSFNSIADSDANLISLERLQWNVGVDLARSSAIISANARYGDLCAILQRDGFALHNLASLGHISVAGACATATHGSGVGNKNLASAVSALEIVTADGELVSLTRDGDGDLFNGAVVGLGALGVVVRLTLDLLPAFEVSQRVYERLPLAALDANFDAIMSSAYSVSLFTDWSSETINQVWLKHRTVDGDPVDQPEFFGAAAATRKLHPIGDLPADACTDQLGIPGAWYERLPHFRIEATPSAGAELQSEYFVAREDAVGAIRAVAQVRNAVAPYLLISEIRTIAADNLWMSPCCQQDSVGLHFTWKPDWAGVKGVLGLIEAALAPYNPRPHWGKLFTMPPERVQALYAKLPLFRDLLREYDPAGKFRNGFVETYIGG